LSRLLEETVAEPYPQSKNDTLEVQVAECREDDEVIEVRWQRLKSLFFNVPCVIVFPSASSIADFDDKKLGAAKERELAHLRRIPWFNCIGQYLFYFGKPQNYLFLQEQISFIDEIACFHSKCWQRIWLCLICLLVICSRLLCLLAMFQQLISNDVPLCCKSDVLFAFRQAVDG
jgi:hypothetical protein